MDKPVSSHLKFSTARLQFFASGSSNVHSNRLFIQVICDDMVCNITGAEISSVMEVAAEDFGLHPRTCTAFLCEFTSDCEVEMKGFDELWMPESVNV